MNWKVVLSLDACYFALGLVLSQASSDSSQLGQVLTTLRAHCSLAGAKHAHLLRRRAAWLLGWTLRTPHFARLAAPSDVPGWTLDASKLGAAGGAAGGAAACSCGEAGGAVHLMYTMLAELLGDTHAGVRLTAALAVQALFDATDTSPRADASPALGPRASRNSVGSLDSPALGPAGGGAAGAAAVEPLAQLAATALMPVPPQSLHLLTGTPLHADYRLDGQVLHLSLYVREIDSRWRMGQLLCRLLSRLGTAPHLLQPHLPALTQWIPTAWAACGGEQLLQEAAVDSVTTLLLAVDSAPAPLLGAALDLVAAASTCTRAGAANGVDADGGAAGGATEPPVGLIDIALRLWRVALASIKPPLRGDELAAQLLPLVGRLPALLELGDELVRPAMLLLDWYLLSDRTGRSCGGGFAPGAPTATPFFTALSPVFERSITCGVGRGTLATVGVMHSCLLLYPEQAAALRPALAAALTCLVAPERAALYAARPSNELQLAAMAGLLGRVLLLDPSLFTAVLHDVAAATGLRLPHVAFATVWLRLGDSVLLSAHRKLAALSLTTALALDAACLPLVGEVTRIYIRSACQVNNFTWCASRRRGPLLLRRRARGARAPR